MGKEQDERYVSCSSEKNLNYSQQRGGTRMRSGVTPGYFSTGSEVYGGDAMCEGVGSGVGGDPVSAVGVGVGGGELVPEPAAPQPTP